MKVNIGETRSSVKCGDYIVIAKTNKKSGYSYYYTIKFIKTGTIKDVLSEQVINGRISDPFYPTVFGVGYLGNALRKGNELAYDKWKAMISRCYYSNNIAYKNYGAKGVYVDNRWLSFENFINDMPLLQGWNEQEFNNGNLVLDKDKLSNDNKYYSKYTCCWISVKENALLSNRKMLRDFIAISPNGERYEGNNATEFAKEHNLTPQRVNDCINKIHESTKGWKFILKEGN